MNKPCTVTDAEVHEVLEHLRELSERPRRTTAGTLAMGLMAALWGFGVGLVIGGSL